MPARTQLEHLTFSSSVGVGGKFEHESMKRRNAMASDWGKLLALCLLGACAADPCSRFVDVYLDRIGAEPGLSPSWRTYKSRGMFPEEGDNREWYYTILLIGQTAVSVDGELTRFTAAELLENPARALPADEPSWRLKNDTYVELDAEGRGAFVALLTGDRRCPQEVLNRLCRAEADRIVRDLAAAWSNRTRSARCLEGLATVIGDSDSAMSSELRAIAKGLREADRWVDDNARGSIAEQVLRALVDVREDLTWTTGPISDPSEAYSLLDRVSDQWSLVADHWSSTVPTRMVRRSNAGFRLLTVGDVIREYATTRCKREFASAEEWIEYCRQRR